MQPNLRIFLYHMFKKYIMNDFRYPHRSPHLVVQQLSYKLLYLIHKQYVLNMVFRIAAGATGYFVFIGNRDSFSSRDYPHWSGG